MTSPKPARRKKTDLAPNGETFRLLFANHPTPMLVYDLKTLAFLDVNEAALEKYGYTRDEFLKLTIKDIRPAEDIMRLIDNLEQKRPALQHSGEWRHRLKNGQVIDVEITSHILDFEGHKAVLVMAQDITERKRAEESLRHNRDLLFALSVASQSVQQARTTEDIYRAVGKEIKALGYDLAIFTLSADHRHLTTTYATFVAGLLRAAEKLTGVRTQGYLLPIQPGSVFERVVDGEKAEFLHQTAADAAQVLPQALRPLAEKLVTFMKVDKGIVAPLRVDGTILGVLTVTGSKLEEGDVYAVEAFAAQVAISLKNAQLTQQVQEELNERKRAEEALRSAGQQWQTTFDAIGDSVCLINTEGHIIRHNRTMETFLGKSASEVDGHLCYELMHGTSEPIGNCPFLRTKQSKCRENMVFEFNGRWLNVTTDPILQSDGQFLGATHIVSDITERKQVEEALRESEDKFRYFFEYSNVGKSITLLSGGMNVNQALCDLLGYTQTEFKAKKWQEITHPDDIELTQKAIDHLLSGEQNSARFNKRFIHKNGSVVWADISSSLRRDKDGKSLYLMTSVIEITERKRAEDALIESEKRFATIFRANPAAIAMTRLDDGHLVDVNAAWQRMTGYLHTEVVGHTPQELNLWVCPEQQERLIEMLGEQGKAHGEMQLHHKSGEIRDLLISADLIELTGKRYVLMMAQDITESKRAAEKLHESEEKYHAVVDKANDGIMIGQDGVIKFSNSSLAAMLGYEVSEMEGVEFREFLPPENTKLLLERYQNRLAGIPIPSLYETALLHKNGGKIPVEVNASVVQLEGKPADLVIMRDITERKRAETQRQNFYDMLNASLNEIYIFDAQTLHFEFVSAGAINNLGYSLDELRQMTPLNLKPQFTPQTFATLIAPLRLGTMPVINFETIHRRADGSLYPVDVHLQLFSHAEHPLFMAVILDITEHRRSEEALRNSEALLAEAQRIGKLGHAEWMKDKDELICSSEMLRIFELPLDSRTISRRSINERVHPEDKKHLAEMDHKLFAEHSDLDYEYRILPSDNKAHWIHQHSQITYDENGEPIRMIGVFQDITERKQVEETLRENAMKLARSQEIGKLGNWDWDIVGNSLQWSDEVYQIWGVEKDFALSFENIAAMIHPDDQELNSKMVQEFFAHSNKGGFEFRIICPNGVIKYIYQSIEVRRDPSNQPIRMFGIMQDITERKQAEETLAESEKKFRTLFETMSEGIVYEDYEGKIISANPAAERFLGLSFEEMQGRTSIDPRWKTIHEDGSPFPGETHSLNVAAKTGKPTTGEIMGIYNPKSDAYVWLSVNSTPEFLPGAKEPFRAYAVFRDITEQIRAEYALMESESLYRKMNENSPLGMHFYKLNNNDQLVFVDANPAANKLLGVDHSQFIGKTIEEAFPSLTQTEVPQCYRDAAAKGVPWSTEQIAYEDKQITGAFEVRAFQTTPGNMVAVFADITERKQAEEALRETSERLTHMLANSPTVIYALKVEGGEVIPNWISNNINAVLGFSAEDGLQPEWWTQQIHPEDRPDALASLEHLFDDFYQHEYRFLRKDGSLIWLHDEHRLLRNADNEPWEIIGAWTDITASKQAENRLRQRSDELNALNVLGREVTASFSSGSATAVALNGIMNAIQPDLAYLFLRENEKLILKESLGCNTEAGTVSLPTHRVGECMCGLSVSEKKAFYSRDIFVDWRCTWDDCKKAGVRSFAALPLRSGNEVFGVIGLGSLTGRDFEQQSEFLETLSSQISAVLENARLFETVKSYASELEQRVEARTSELHEAQEKLVRNEKLAVLGQLAGSVGHELRNPLAVINSALYYLKLVGTNGNEKVKEYLGIIQTEAHTCEKIITDLLDFARIKSVDVEPVSVSELVERVLERYPIPEAVSLALYLPENLPAIYVDPRQMEQVLGNLVINACQAMSDGGRLTITARQEQEMVAIAVQDTGVGILPENMKKLFEPLFTTKAKGVGLGLAVSQKLVEANGGRIEVQSEAGVGSTFTLVLPVIHNG